MALRHGFRFRTNSIIALALSAVALPGLAKAADSSSSQVGPSLLEEVVVTAQKREEKLTDVPASISVISGERLEALNVTSLADLASYVPGMSVQSNGAPGFSQIVLRGINTNANNYSAGPTVGTYIDDLPVNSSSNGSRGGEIGADLNPYDIDRIEVLKGPQGTFYGSSTLGGLVRYILKKPNFDAFDVRAGASIESIDGSGSPGYAVNGAVNVPIVSDHL